MSTNVSFTGISVKLNKKKIDKESLLELAKFLKYDEKELESFNSEDDGYIFYEPKKNQWSLYRDYDGNIGLVYLIDDESDVFDLAYSMSLEKLNEIMGELVEDMPNEYIDMNAASVKVFAHLYYNGSDNPFTF